jgi:hypothetical protein
MKAADGKTLIYNGLRALLADHGFRLNKGQATFIRRIPDGRQSIGVPFYSYDPEYYFSLTVTIRLDAVEDIVNQFSGSPPAYHAMTETIITHLDYFTGQREPKYKVTCEADVTAALATLAPVVQQGILPFLDRLRDAPSLDQAVNGQPYPSGGAANAGLVWAGRRDAVDSSNQPYRAMHALVLARLAGNPEFERLATQAEADRTDLNAVDREKLGRLLASLRGAT